MKNTIWGIDMQEMTVQALRYTSSLTWVHSDFASMQAASVYLTPHQSPHRQHNLESNGAHQLLWEVVYGINSSHFNTLDQKEGQTDDYQNENGYMNSMVVGGGMRNVLKILDYLLPDQNNTSEKIATALSATKKFNI